MLATIYRMKRVFHDASASARCLLELIQNSGLPGSALIAVGTDHRLADGEPLKMMLKAVEGWVEGG